MHPKRTVLILMTAFAAVWITDLVVHELILRKDYLNMMNVWRSPATLQNFLKWLVVGEFMAAAGLTVLWINRGAPTSTRPASAVRFGLFAGLLTNAYVPVLYAVMPLPGLVCLKWVLFGTLQSIIVSLVLYYITRALAPKADEARS